MIYVAANRAHTMFAKAGNMYNTMHNTMMMADFSTEDKTMLGTMQKSH